MYRPNVLVFFLALAGCGNLKDYDVTLNDRVLYTPRPLAVAQAVADPALAACIGQHLKDQKAASAEQLTALSCTQAGITLLVGIEVYKGLTGIKLTDNDIVDASPLAKLGHLDYLNLNGNDRIDCTTLGDIDASELITPEHCRS